MGIQVLMIGKFKNQHYQSAAQEYCHRINCFHPCEIIPARESRYRDEKKYASQIIEEEGANLLRSAPDNACLVVLDRAGKRMDSIKFSRFLDEILNINQESLSFCIGGFLGVAQSVKSRARQLLSLSEFTLPHELATVVTLEQVYRGFTLLKRIPYHK